MFKVDASQNSLLEWEKDWIYENGERYENAFHQIQVMDNVTKRYEAKDFRYTLTVDEVSVKLPDIELFLAPSF